MSSAPGIKVDIQNGNINDMYVWDVAWQETFKKGKNASLKLKMSTAVRRDSNANKIGDINCIIPERRRSPEATPLCAGFRQQSHIDLIITTFPEALSGF